MRRFNWAGASILVLAIFLGSGWATALVMSASSRTPPITDSTKDLLTAIGGVLAGAITAYIGGYVAGMHGKGGLQDKQSEADGSEADCDQCGPQRLRPVRQEGGDGEDDEGDKEADVGERQVPCGDP